MPHIETVVAKPFFKPLATTSTNIITVVRDPSTTLGKKILFDADGLINKQASVNLSFGFAIQRNVETPDEFAALLKEVGEDPHAAIINAVFDDISIDEEFVILSAKALEQLTGIPRSDRDHQKGIHQITHKDKSYKAVGRFKENVQPSSWQYFDRDIDQHTPEALIKLSIEDWLSKIAKFTPGVSGLSYVHVSSTSARVLRDNTPVSSSNGHLWFKVKDPADIERFRTALLIAAAQAGVTWKKPRFSRKEQGKVVGHSLTTIIDTSVFTPGRLVFIGQPVVSGGLTVIPLQCTIHKGQADTLDTSKVTLPKPEIVREITLKAGVKLDVTRDGQSWRITANNLTLDTELETEDHGVMTVREYLKQGLGKVRCQTPFRESSSYAAFISRSQDGKPFVHDVGTGITHWLNDEERGGCSLAIAKGKAKSIIERAAQDCGAPFEPTSVETLALIKKHDQAEFTRIRADLKKANKEISVVNLDKEIRAVATHENLAQTHHGYATDMMAELTVAGNRPVAYQGNLFVLDFGTSIWTKLPFETLTHRIAEAYDGHDNCTRSSDYSGIAGHVIRIATDDSFFTNVPVGLACTNGFHHLEGNQMRVAPLSASHRQRVLVDIALKKQDIPLFNDFLHTTFKSNEPEEEKQQITLLQEIVGAIVLGLMARYQKAVQFYDPFGRAGKGTLERIITSLIPDEFISAVSPFKWNGEYYLASLAGSRLNSVGELPDSKPIPAAEFKTVTGGDLLTGRHPTHRPFTFKNEAAHLFMSNHLITTNDHSEAFYTRWLIVEFPNSRLKTGLPIDPGLAERIIKNEISGIAHWALEGVIRLMENGKFSTSKAHDRLMTKWRRTTNSLEEFIHEECLLGNEKSLVRRSKFYEVYKDWCKDNGRHPFSKGRVKDLLASNINLGITHTSLDGYEIFRGIDFKPTPKISSIEQ